MPVEGSRRRGIITMTTSHDTALSPIAGQQAAILDPLLKNRGDWVPGLLPVGSRPRVQRQGQRTAQRGLWHRESNISPGAAGSQQLSADCPSGRDL